MFGRKLSSCSLLRLTVATVSMQPYLPLAIEILPYFNLCCPLGMVQRSSFRCSDGKPLPPENQDQPKTRAAAQPQNRTELTTQSPPIQKTRELFYSAYFTKTVKMWNTTNNLPQEASRYFETGLQWTSLRRL